MLSYAFNIYKNKQTFLVLVKKKKRNWIMNLLALTLFSSIK